MDEAISSAQVHESAEIGQPADPAMTYIALLQLTEQSFFLLTAPTTRR